MVSTMGAHPDDIAYLHDELRNAETKEDQDVCLDVLHDVTTRATDYDAVHWGFIPSRWMFATRDTLKRNKIGPPEGWEEVFPGAEETVHNRRV